MPQVPTRSAEPLRGPRLWATHTGPMFINLSKKPRKATRSKSNRYRAKLKAKDRCRRGRVYQAGRK